ncbi:hypothetical protein SAMN05660865_01797 [Caloramator fervidus]|uniref:Repeat domain-containing protein n=1 Tax=Caloramator fervidus TaxID=29344 RepID=A0A1H5XK64_9CLOT|nr:VCBS repeat-containing protein [Caloramator fervidus]SEG12174.1 hypothetical protein SAMN05660865_01797 [Caloramator fervidus]
MKLKIYVVKKQQIIWGLIILAAIILAAIVLIFMKTKQTINTFNQPNTYYTDLNNNGKTDCILVTTNEKTGEYNVSVRLDEKKTLGLEPDTTIKTLGFFNKNWPMNINFVDIDKDKNLEIILQASDSKGPILHVYKLKDQQIAKLLSGRYSIFGLINTKDFEPVLVIGNKTKDDIRFNYLTFNSTGPIPYIMPTSMNLGKNSINSLLGYIETQEVEAANINQKHLDIISKGKFLDGTISEIRYDKYDVPTQCTYLIRTLEETPIGNENSIYKVTLGLTKYDSRNPQYKILSIIKIK